MPLSKVSYFGDGSTVSFSLTMPVLDLDHVEVYVDGVRQVEDTDYHYTSFTTVTFYTPPTAGSIVLLKRNTPKDARLVDYNNSSMLTEEALDLDSNQIMYIVQEAYDNMGESVVADDVEANAIIAQAAAATATAQAAAVVDVKHKGDWLPSTEYKVGNIIFDPTSGGSFMCILGHISSLLFDTDKATKWEYLAVKGDQGEPGPAGADGADGSGASTSVDVTDYGAVADFVLGPGSTKVSGTDNTAAFDAALATGKEIFVPAGDYWVSNATTRYNLQFRTMHGPGVLWGNTNVGYTRLGKSLVVGTNRSHEMGSVGGLHIGAEDGGFGMRQWMGHHNWMQFQPSRYGAPTQVQIYPSVMACTATPQSPNRLNAVYGTFNTSELFVGDYIGWNGQLFVVDSVTTSYITVSKAFVGGSPAFTTDGTLEKPVFKAYETARGTCNVSGTTVTFVDGEQFPYGYSGDHQYVFLNGTKYNVTAGPEVAGPNTLTLASSAGTITGASFAYYRQYAPWSYVSLLRLQGIAGGKESVGVFSINTRNEVLIGAAATHVPLVGNMRVEAPRIRIGMGEQYPYNGTTDRYGIEVVSPMEDQSFGAHYVGLGGYNGREAVRVITWNEHTDRLTMYGSVAGVNPGPTIAAEGATANLDLIIKAKGSGAVQIGDGVSTDDTSNWFATGVNGYWSTGGTHLKIAASGSGNNPPVWIQNTVSWNSGIYDHFASAAMYETVKTSGASCPNSLTGSIKVSGGTGDAIGVHGQVVCEVTNGGAMTGVWGRATGPTSAPTTGMICGLEVNVDNRHGATSYKARKDGGALVGALIYNFSGAGKANHFGFVVEGAATDAYHVGGLIEDFQAIGLSIVGTRSASAGITITSESVDQLTNGIKFWQRCANGGIDLGPNKLQWGLGSQAGAASNNGDMLYNDLTNILYFNQGGTVKEAMFAGAPATSGSYTAARKIPVNIGGTTYYLLAATSA